MLAKEACFRKVCEDKHGLSQSILKTPHKQYQNIDFK